MYLESFLLLACLVLHDVSIHLRSDPGCCQMVSVSGTCAHLS